MVGLAFLGSHHACGMMTQGKQKGHEHEGEWAWEWDLRVPHILWHFCSQAAQLWDSPRPSLLFTLKGVVWMPTLSDPSSCTSLSREQQRRTPAHGCHTRVAWVAERGAGGGGECSTGAAHLQLSHTEVAGEALVAAMTPVPSPPGRFRTCMHRDPHWLAATASQN